MGYNLISPTKVSNAAWIHAIFTYSTNEGFHFPLFFWIFFLKKFKIYIEANVLTIIYFLVN